MPLSPFPIAMLAWPAFVVLVAGFLIALAFTRRPVLSGWVAVIKTGLFLLYFGVLFDGTFTFLDDWTYLHVGEQLASQGVGILNFIRSYHHVLSTVGTLNLSYFVYNASAVELLGHGYYAPVALNILLTFLAAGMLMKAARIGLRMGPRASIGLYACLALSPGLLAWSTVANLKDVLVATATSAVIYAVALVDGHRMKRALLFAAAGVAILVVTRFYVPLTLGVAFGVTLMFSRRGRRNPWLWLMVILALIVVVHVLGHASLSGAMHRLRSSVGNPVAGLIRFTLTPIPFHTDPAYAFLDIPQLIYWLLLPFEVCGIVAVWRRKTMTGRFMVIYLVLMTLLYGVLTSLQDPRHRIQIDGLIVIFQYYEVLALLRAKFGRRRQPAPVGAGGHGTALAATLSRQPSGGT